MRHALTLAFFSLSVGCTVSSRQPTPQWAPCAPGDPSWGCRSASQTPPTNVAATGAPSAVTVSPQPTAATGQPPQPVNTIPAAGTSLPGTQAPLPATPAPQAVTDDPINRADIGYQRQRVSVVLGELVAALDSTTRARVQNLPLTFDPDRNNVNAFASCTRSGKATIAITDGMLILTAYLAQLQAADEANGARHFDEYVARVARYQRDNTPPLAPDPSWVTVDARSWATKSARQAQLNDEMFAFVMAHELGHHYLNHLPCTSILPLDASEIGIVLTSVVPAFNQPAEAASDVAATRNVLQAGRKRPSAQLTEGGALLTMRFFRALDQSTTADIFNFERTHPPPATRETIVTSTAQAFRATGGLSWPW